MTISDAIATAKKHDAAVILLRSSNAPAATLYICRRAIARKLPGGIVAGAAAARGRVGNGRLCLASRRAERAPAYSSRRT